MKVSELRIGNYYAIAREEGIVYPQVRELKINEFRNYSSDGDNLELAAKPIPLTEEWLERFGFRNKHNVWQLNAITNYVVVKSPFDGFIMRLNGGKVRLKHVHQLQNLWRSLTSQELELKKAPDYREHFRQNNP